MILNKILLSVLLTSSFNAFAIDKDYFINAALETDCKTCARHEHWTVEGEAGKARFLQNAQDHQGSPGFDVLSLPETMTVAVNEPFELADYGVQKYDFLLSDILDATAFDSETWSMLMVSMGLLGLIGWKWLVRKAWNQS